MALQAARSSNTWTGIFPVKAVALAIAGLKFYSSGPQEQSLLEWEIWIELFAVAMMAKHSVSLTELTRT